MASVTSVPQRLEVPTPDPSIVLVMGRDLRPGDVLATGKRIHIEDPFGPGYESVMYAVRRD